jgi:FkbM family methyltransferase
MPRTSATLDRVHRWLARSRTITRAAIAVRNQCRAVIKYRLMSDHDVRVSGEQWLATLLGAQCRNAVDVGANRGEWTEMLLERAPNLERAVLFEPAGAAAATLREKFAARGQVTVIEAAVGDRECADAPFFVEGGDGEMSTMTLGASTPAAVESRVRVTTLDAELARLGIDRVDLLKIDVEGNDLAALRGASGLLRQQSVAVVQWEYGDAWAPSGATLAAALDFLESLGYRSFLLKRDGIYGFDYDTFGDFFTYANFVSFRNTDQPPAEAREL